MADKKQDFKFPTETVDLPSGGSGYEDGSVLSSGKIELKYMTAKEEDILTSQNLIKKGVVIDVLLDSLLVDKNIKVNDLLLGDKNAIMVASRILAYGPEYECTITHPETADKIVTTINLADCPFKKLPEGATENRFEVKLPVSKTDITFKLLTGKEEKQIDADLKSSKKIGSQVSPELTTRLRYTITAVDGNNSAAVINKFVENMLSRDSLALRNKIQEISPDIELKQEVEMENETVEVDIPLTVEFFWPSTLT